MKATKYGGVYLFKLLTKIFCRGKIYTHKGEEVRSMNTPKDIARYIIITENQNDTPISNLRLQKLMYFVQASLVTAKRNLYFCNGMQAWKYGPVIPEIYKEYRFYGSQNIIEEIEYDDMKICTDDKEIIDSTLQFLRDLSTSHLIEISHKQDPWIDSWRNEETKEITRCQMVKYFEI